ncbi:hypothetical protein [Pseudoroseicyclus aestuarii]|uniref:DUF2125 domain-containing protein n=1 Tax=Pseudoroseicyclus aestuarii TaxID=1795041 RepID=A0A318T5Z6_9RHOB|nr:hypothetical protein [Pseudoroseicyclus aestuarii]PYE85834.1 hypothetical protein DFP88_101507 [Pseudoroseicyclus aestuarii]
MRLAAALCMLALPAAAQEAEDCTRLWSVAQQRAEIGGFALEGRVTQDASGCAAEDVSLLPEGGYASRILADRVTLAAPDLGPALAGGPLPDRAELGVEGLRIAPLTGDPITDWLLAEQAYPGRIGAELALRADPKSGHLLVEALRIDFGALGTLALSARIEGLRLASASAFGGSLGQAGLTTLDAEVTSDGLFETYALIPLGSLLLQPGADPEVQVEALKQAGERAIAAAPEAMLDVESRAALTALLGDMPHPSGRIAASLAIEPPLGPGRLTPAPGADPSSILRGMALSVDYEPAS